MTPDCIVLAGISLIVGWFINSIYAAFSTPSPRCAKCGTHFGSYWFPTRKYVESSDQIKMTCRSCGYAWHEAPVIVADRRTNDRAD